MGAGGTRALPTHSQSVVPRAAALRVAVLRVGVLRAAVLTVAAPWVLAHPFQHRPRYSCLLHLLSLCLVIYVSV